MNHLNSKGHSATIEICRSWEIAFDYLKQPLNLGKWALGSQDTKPTDKEGLYTGTSIFNKEQGFFKIVADKSYRLLDFHVGDQTSLTPRISMRVIPGPHYGNSDSYCLVTLDAWRDLQMSNERWHQLCSCHETEVLLLKSLIEQET
jgi:hypothetical protein